MLRRRNALSAVGKEKNGPDLALESHKMHFFMTISIERFAQMLVPDGVKRPTYFMCYAFYDRRDSASLSLSFPFSSRIFCFRCSALAAFRCRCRRRRHSTSSSDATTHGQHAFTFYAMWKMRFNYAPRFACHRRLAAVADAADAAHRIAEPVATTRLSMCINV